MVDGVLVFPFPIHISPGHPPPSLDPSNDDRSATIFGQQYLDCADSVQCRCTVYRQASTLCGLTVDLNRIEIFSVSQNAAV